MLFCSLACHGFSLVGSIWAELDSPAGGGVAEAVDDPGVLDRYAGCDADLPSQGSTLPGTSDSVVEPRPQTPVPASFENQCILIPGKLSSSSLRVDPDLCHWSPDRIAGSWSEPELLGDFGRIARHRCRLWPSIDVANWVAGWVLLIESVPDRRPNRCGRNCRGGRSVGARSTWVRTYDNEVIIVPNSDFTTHQVTNWTVNDDRVRLAIGVVVAHDSDAEKVAALLLEVARENPSVLTNPPPEALLNDLAKDSLIFSLRFWTIIEAMTTTGSRVTYAC